MHPRVAAVFYALTTRMPQKSPYTTLLTQLAIWTHLIVGGSKTEMDMGRSWCTAFCDQTSGRRERQGCRQ